jgi:hypothetical protein
MSFKSGLWPLALALSFPAVAQPGAQSLAEIARQEEARRKEIRQPAKVYTNKDLASVPPSSAPAPGPEPSAKAAAPAAAESKDAANEAKEAPQAQDAKDKPVVKDQKYWAGRMRDLSTQLDRDQILADALQSRINGLTADFAARDDPAQRAVIGRDRQKAIDELARLKLAIQNTKKAIADLEEEARRASVPPGWLR